MGRRKQTPGQVVNLIAAIVLSAGLALCATIFIGTVIVHVLGPL